MHACSSFVEPVADSTKKQYLQPEDASCVSQLCAVRVNTFAAIVIST